MKFGINVATLGDYADPRLVVQLARAAEDSGWQGLFVWDHLAFAWGAPSGDPWVILAAVAQATSRLVLGPLVTPLPRRRPYVLANTLATLDRLSEGRTILGAGLGGVPLEFTAFGEDDGLRQRARRLDEGLEILNRLWSGEELHYQGEFYAIDGVTLAPLPVQRPRVPIWIGGESSAALRRAAQWDGWAIGGDDQDGRMIKTPQEFAAQVGTIRQLRSTMDDFEVALSGTSLAGDGAVAAEFAAAGATWWLESLHGLRGSFDDLMERIKAGPPH